MTEQTYLRPKEIAKRGLIRNGTGGDNVDANYVYILRVIKAGKLKAKDYGTGSRPYWKVSMAEIKRYNSEVNN